MVKKRTSIFDWNHISHILTDNEIKELKNYYKTYHRKFWSYGAASQYYKRLRLLLNVSSLLIGSGGVISAAVTSGTSLIAISGVAILLQSYMKYKNLDNKIEHCSYCYQQYRHLIDQIKFALRSGQFEKNNLLFQMLNTDSLATDLAPNVDKWKKKYSDKFTPE